MHGPLSCINDLVKHSSYLCAIYSNIIVHPHTAGLDYTTVNTVLTFSPTDTRQCTNVPILDDDVVENNEVINLSATLPVFNPLITIDGSAMITILDFDGEEPAK